MAWDLQSRAPLFLGGQPSAASVPTIGHMANPFEFIQEVRQEGNKVTWPNRRETVITTVLVMLMCVLASAFLAITDQAIHLAIQVILGFGH